MGVASWVVLVAGCNPVPVHVAARTLAPLPVGTIRRIAVLPFTESPAVRAMHREVGQEPIIEAPGDTVTTAMMDAMFRRPTWQIVDPLLRNEAFRQLYGEVRAPTPDEARAVGELLAVDAVLRGQVSGFEERVGTGLAAERPARVVFAVELMRIPSGEVLWQAEYAETQQALSENLWNLGGFVRAGAKWVRARELAALGADQVAARLHTALYGGSGAAVAPAPASARAGAPAGTSH